MDPLPVLERADETDSLFQGFLADLAGIPSSSSVPATPPNRAALLGVAALDAFLQANVTGPVLPEELCASVEKRLVEAWAGLPQPGGQTLEQLRQACFKNLEIDGVSPYAHISHLELFSLAKYALCTASTFANGHVLSISEGGPNISVGYLRLRVNIWHYKLLTQPSLGPGSNFARSSQWSDVPSLESLILEQMEQVRNQIFASEIWAESSHWSKEEQATFLIEAANTYILLGRIDKAKESLRDAAQTTGLQYALSGALGKRTKFQEKSISQLVVLAKSADAPDANDVPLRTDEASLDETEETVKPEALPLNNDTLLEEIHFTKDDQKSVTPKTDNLPAALAELSPDEQPQLSPLDQIILLTEATIKDAFSPTDTLTAEEVLPFAVRVLGDKSTNWQIYTQALLVRSRIELHRSRTVERGVLQLQAVADQVIADTTFDAPTQPEAEKESNGSPNVPSIQVTDTNSNIATSAKDKPTSFLPAPKPSESAPAHVRLRYIHVLCAPPRWHLESELAYAWAGVGSLVSALEIFKRLRLWAEVALCLASAAAAEDEEGRGSGGEEKARGIIRWRLFHHTEASNIPDSTPEEELSGQDATALKVSDFSGPERDPPPPNAPRLWCILGDLEDEPAHYERAWIVSNNRFARAQKSLAEYYLQKKDLHKALDAYKKATHINRFSPDMWGRLGDINLRLGDFHGAAEAFTRSISSATDTEGGEDARTWSNLGSALWSQYCEVTAQTDEASKAKPAVPDDDSVEVQDETKPDPSLLLARSLAAYKKGASIAHDNWRIWDNVVTLASRVSPPIIPDMVLALKNIIRIRHSEDALDIDLLSALLQDAVLSKDKEPGSTIFEPPRGSPERLISLLIEDEIVPLITHRPELWSLVSRLRAWRRDYAGAVDARERAWRATVGSSGGSLLPGTNAAAASSSSSSSSPPPPASRDWATDRAAWDDVVQRTDELASALETWGPDVDTIGPKWKSRVRSAVRTVMGRGRENWEGSDGWKTLEGIMEGLKA
ncbi:hypothetical protein S40285_03467 [Stachybotrys chlorohalonatus IBT 40285]|uniref:Uncharacterized protein n=1 Tax=Stachybotrys chlorohalonatus (strain IBT 40285) TaxID=1283841 RepID=A0A084QCJ2_STAC4|nr:hypothetical protein S40285_03467 [Stachybotrys chlorohalonata IBT 40285]